MARIQIATIALFLLPFGCSSVEPEPELPRKGYTVFIAGPSILKYDYYARELPRTRQIHDVTISSSPDGETALFWNENGALHHIDLSSEGGLWVFYPDEAQLLQRRVDREELGDFQQ
jgi:hypothetical protein